MDDKNGMLCGGTTFASTSDGGMSWNQKLFNETIQDIQFLSKDVGYLMTQTEIFKSINDGVSWMRSCRVPKDRFIELYFIDPDTGWAVGENGLLLQLK